MKRAPPKPLGGGGAGPESGILSPRQYCTPPVPHPLGKKSSRQSSSGRASGVNILVTDKALEGMSRVDGASAVRSDMVCWLGPCSLVPGHQMSGLAGLSEMYGNPGDRGAAGGPQ